MPNPQGRPPRPVADRFWPKVDVRGPDECWLWTGSSQNAKSGYGQITDEDGTKILTHRLSYRLAHGLIPDDKIVCHRCDVPRCVNPAHLFLGTYRDNTADMVSKGRYRNAYAERTHCKRGHEYSEENTLMYRGYRLCRECRRINSVLYRKVA